MASDEIFGPRLIHDAPVRVEVGLDQAVRVHDVVPAELSGGYFPGSSAGDRCSSSYSPVEGFEGVEGSGQLIGNSLKWRTLAVVAPRGLVPFTTEFRGVLAA